MHVQAPRRSAKRMTQPYTPSALVSREGLVTAIGSSVASSVSSAGGPYGANGEGAHPWLFPPEEGGSVPASVVSRISSGLANAAQVPGLHSLGAGRVGFQ